MRPEKVLPVEEACDYTEISHSYLYELISIKFLKISIHSGAIFL